MRLVLGAYSTRVGAVDSASRVGPSACGGKAFTIQVQHFDSAESLWLSEAGNHAMLLALSSPLL